MRVFSHGPLGFDAQPFPRDFMSRAESPHKITDTTRKRSNEQFDWTETGVMTTVID